MSDNVSLKEYVEKLSAWLKEHFQALFDERDKREQQRFEAQQQAIKDALISQEKAVAAALAAAKEAVTENKLNQKQQLEAHNGLIRKMEIQTNTFIPRAEADVKFQSQREQTDQQVGALSKEISDLRTSRDTVAGRNNGLNAGWGYLVGAVGLLIGVYAALRN
jgi:hypothetical protein